MIKEMVRAAGIGCLLAGAILYMSSDLQASDSGISEKQLQDLQAELERTKEALALAQTVSSEKKTVADKPAGQETADTKEQKPEQPAMVKTVLTIQPGMTSTETANALERLGIIDDAREFEQLLADQNSTGKLQIGEYELTSSMDMYTVAKTITSAK